MDWGYLYTSFDGRINRKPYWLASLAMLVPLIIVMMIAMFSVGTHPTTQLWVNIVFSLVIAYPGSALVVKRLHDRNRPSILLAVLWAPTVLILLGQLTGLTGDLTEAYGQTIFLPNGLGWVVNILSFAVGIYAFVDLGCLRGTQGDNQYGPDPLAGQ